MATRRPVRHPFAYVTTQGGDQLPALILNWVHGHPSDPAGWFAEVVVNSTNDPGHPVTMMVAAADLRPA